MNKEDKDIDKAKADKSPWTIYSHAYDVPKDKMGKAMKESLKACKSLLSLSKSKQSGDHHAKTMISALIHKQPHGSAGGKDRQAQSRAIWAHVEEAARKKVKPKDPGKISTKKEHEKEKVTVNKSLEDVNMLLAKSVLGFASHENVPDQVSAPVEKAMTAVSMPRVPRAMMSDTYRSATSVLTRTNTGLAKDMHTGPLTGELIQDLKDEEDLRTRNLQVYKSCSGCGRTYLAKSESAECPTCSVNKSQHCSKCGTYLTKSQGGISCPLCG